MTGPSDEDTRVAAASPEAEHTPDPPHWLRKVILFLGGQTVSLLGSMLVQYAVFWYLTIEYRSGVVMMLAALFGFLPQAVVSIFGGVWADRHNRKYLIMLADAGIAASTLALALIMLSGYDAVWLIFLTMAVRSAGAGIQMPAVSALIPQITPARNLMRVNGINGSIQSAMALLAPAAAGAIYAWSSAANERLGGIARADLLHRRGDRDHRHRPARAHSRRRRPTRRRRADRILRRPRRRRALRRAPRVRALAAGAVRDHLRADRGALQPHAADARAHVRRRRAAERDQPRGARDLVQRRAWCSAASSSPRSSPSAAGSA